MSTTQLDSETPPGSHAELAAFLLRCSMGTAPPRSPGSPYRQGLELWEASADFRDTVRAIAAGLGLVVADCNVFGMALAVRPDSAFAPSAARLHNFYANGSTSKNRPVGASDARAVLGIALMTTAALAYPDENALDGTGTAPPRVLAREVRERMEALARLSRDEAEASDMNDSHTDDNDEEGGKAASLRRMFDAVLECSPLKLSPTGKQIDGTLAWHVMKAFEALHEHGHAQLSRGGGEDEESGVSIIPKDRWRKLLRHHAAAETHAAVRLALGRLPPPLPDLAPTDDLP